ncbi:MAG: protein kinase [Thermoanaerobaculia bacterium]
MPVTLERGFPVAHYTIVGALGAGGMGEVYEAHDERLERSVAIKILPPSLVADQGRVRRFIQEARSASGLNHPNIVHIYDIGEAEPPSVEGTGEFATPISQLHFIAMELVRGVTLKEKIHRERTPLRDLVGWLAQVADGMAKAHAAGIIHRDLKPENVMITRDGFAKILDFGLAKLTERADALGVRGDATTVVGQTREGAIVGTVGYMSPEQVQGKPVDERSDIFAFGCMLYEAATRHQAFNASSDIETLHRILNVPPTPVTELNPDVPTELRRIIRRCLEKDPEKRYQSMKDLSLALHDIEAEFDQLSISSPSRGSDSGIRAMISPQKKRSALAVVSAVALLGIGALVAWYVMRHANSRSSAPLSATFARLTSGVDVESEPSLSPDGKYIAFTARPNPSIENSDVYLQRVGGSNAIDLTPSSPDDDYQAAFSPDGQQIAFRSERGGGGIFVMGATGESVHRLTDFGYNPSWSPDGKSLVVGTESGHDPSSRVAKSALWIVDVASGTKKKIYDGDAVRPAWSPHGTRIAFWALPEDGSGQRDVATIPAGGGEAVKVTDDSPMDWSPVWSPDGTTLYFASDRGGSMNVWAVAIDESSGKPEGALRPLTTPSQWSGDLSTALHAPELAYTTFAAHTDVQKIGFDVATLTAHGPPAPVTAGAMRFIDESLSPAGDMVAMRSVDSPEDLWVVHTDGSGLRKLTDDASKERGPRWTPDGKEIVFYSDRGGSYNLWSVHPDGSDLSAVSNFTSPDILSPVVSPDGKRLAASADGDPFLFALAGTPHAQRERLSPMPAGLRFQANDWSPDGTLLVGSVLKGSEPEPGLWIYSIAKRSYEKLTDHAGGYRGRARFLPDGRHLIFADGTKMFLLDRLTKEEKEIFDTRHADVLDPQVSSDGTSIYYVAASMEGDVWMATIK